MSPDLFQTSELDQYINKMKENTNTKRVMCLLNDYKLIDTFTIMEKLFPSGKAGLFRLAAIIHSQNKQLARIGWVITGKDDQTNPQKYWYQLEVLNGATANVQQDRLF